MNPKLCLGIFKGPLIVIYTEINEVSSTNNKVKEEEHLIVPFKSF